MNSLLRFLTAAAVAISIALAGCATVPPPAPDERAAAPAQGSAPAAPVAPLHDRALEERLLALDPLRLSDDDVRHVLARGPTPRIMLLHGGLYPVHLLMESFGRFLTRMGYPEARIRDPGDRAWSYSPYEDAEKLAGIVAWEYETSGLHPMLIGHSQGGMQAVKVLHELAGHFDKAVRVYDPVRGAFLDRTSIVDPLTHRERPVVGLSVSYASAVGAGGATFLMPNQWSMLDKLESIPNTVAEFTGFTVGIDLIGGSSHYRHNGTAKVRNVALPLNYNHIFVPAVGSLADDPQVRDWINAYAPGDTRDPSLLPGDAPQHVLWAADVWYSIKKHWCLEAQRLVRAERERKVPSQSAAKDAPPGGGQPTAPTGMREAERAPR